MDDNAPSDAECIAKIAANPEAAYRVLLEQDAEIERLRAEIAGLRSSALATRMGIGL